MCLLGILNKKGVFMKKTLIVLMIVLMAVSSLWASGNQESDGGTTSIKMYYPVGVAGPLAKLMEEMVAEFNESQNDVEVEAVFAGGYTEALEKTRTAVLSGNPPALAVLDAPTLLTLKDIDAIVPLDPFIEQDGGKAFTDEFLEGFLKIGLHEGKLWSIPWQRSTPMFYYNKTHFKEAGLDPETPPTTWDEVIAKADKLVVVDGKGNVQRWGMELAINFWLFKPMVLQAGGILDSEDGTKLNIDTEEARAALNYMQTMVDQGSMPAIKQWSESVSDFAAGATSMIYNSTGALGFIRKSMTDDFGTAFLPAGKRQVAIEGGGNFFIFKTDEKEQQAAWEFIKWMTTPENTARWSMGSGYIPVKQAAFEVPEYKAYTEEWPQALTAYNQLMQSDMERNMMTHHVNAINKLVNGTLERIMAGENVDSTLLAAQQEADDILKNFQ
jgi:sn-glycerol 3-phosphate transport system substrate-binding protein